MKKLRLTKEEKELLMQSIQEKFDKTGKYDVSSFEYTSKDLKDFLNDKIAKTVKKPTVLINADVYTKMYELVKQSNIEIQWHLMVKRYKEEAEYLVYDILLFPQTNSGTSTTTDQDEFAEWQMELIKDKDFPLEDLRGHGHSHVNMNVYSSGVDDAYQRDLTTKAQDGDYYLFLVLNKKMEMYALLYDFDQQIVFETKDMTLEILDEDGVDIKAWCESQIKTYCKTVTRPTKAYYSHQTKDTNLELDKILAREEELIANIKQTGSFYGRRR